MAIILPPIGAGPGPINPVDIRRVDPADPAVRVLIESHLAHSWDATPQTSNHTMSSDGLIGAGVLMYGAYLRTEAVGCAGLKPVDTRTAEVKSVHVLPSARGSGVARHLMEHLHKTAVALGICDLVLETGSARLSEYTAARRLYEGLGYRYCGPIPGYTEDPNSAFMCLALDRGR